MGDTRGGSARASNILQHGLVDKLGGEADAGETTENARTVSRKKDRIFFGGMMWMRNFD
jgi:hypothetical protein